MKWPQALHIDKFLLLLISVVALATVLPCSGIYEVLLKKLTIAAIALLFFMHGAKLSRQAIFDGLRHWRLHIVVLLSTFALFPLLGFAMNVFVPMGLISPTIYYGFLYLCALPATVQSAIAYTSMANGNVAAAICSASASSILGIFLSPFLVGLLMHTQGESHNTWQAIHSIFLQLMLPFIIGHLCRPLIVKWLQKHKKIINKTDRISILLVVYTAFSAAVTSGLWNKIDAGSLLSIVIYSCLLLAIVIAFNIFTARLLGFSTQDEVTIVFCGSKKSLVNGIPMANVLFPASAVGIMVLPLMIFHQIQLMVCATIATYYAKKIETSSKEDRSS